MALVIFFFSLDSLYCCISIPQTGSTSNAKADEQRKIFLIIVTNPTINIVNTIFTNIAIITRTIVNQIHYYHHHQNQSSFKPNMVNGHCPLVRVTIVSSVAYELPLLSSSLVSSSSGIRLRVSSRGKRRVGKTSTAFPLEVAKHI